MISSALAVFLLPVLVQDPMPDELLSKLKLATALVRIQVDGDTVRSGSGVLVSKEGDRGIVVTSPALLERLPREGTYSIQVVLERGGPGEKSLEAEFSGVNHALGALKVVSKALPPPLSPAPRAKLKETLPVYILGFPYADLGMSDALAVTRGRISRLTQDPSGVLSSVSVDADLIPGAAVVDSTGAFIGMATNQQWVLPAPVIEETLLGSVSDIQWTMLENRAGTIRCRLTAMVVDPKNKVGEISVRIGRRNLITDRGRENPDGTWGRIEGDVREIALKRDEKGFRGEFVVKGEVEKSADYVWQWWWARGDGRKFHAGARDRSFSFEKDLNLPGSSEGVSKPAEPAKPRSADPEPGDWLEDRRRRPAIEALKPEKTGAPLAADKSAPEGAQVTRLKLDAAHLEPCLAWAEGGEAAIVLDRFGLIRRVSIPDLKEEARLNSGRQCAGLAKSKAGLVTYCVEQQELWLLDDKSLELRRRLSFPPVTSLAAAPASALVYVLTRGSQVIQVVDVEKMEVARKWEYQERSTADARVKRHERSGRLRLEAAQAAVTPDGAWLLVAADGSLHRLKISGNDLAYEEAGPAFAHGGRLEVSADSKYATIALAFGHTLPPGAPRVDGNPILIFKIEDLQGPVITLVTKRGASAVAFDREARKLYTAEEGKLLVSFTPKGERAAVFDADPAAGSPRQFLVHPSGRRLFILNDAGLYWMELAP